MKVKTENPEINRFLADTVIDIVEDNGLSIYRHFHTEAWGDFKARFKFHINQDGKIYLLAIGQAE